jgi:xylan 1,4-beta-xylosidase
MQGNAHVSCTKYKNLNNISHYHSDHELVCVCEGNANVFINENFFHLRSKDCIFVHSNDIHHIQSDPSTVITVLKARQKHFESIFASYKLRSPLIGKSAQIEGTLNSIAAELKAGTDHSHIMADCIATQLFITMLRGEPTQTVESAESGRTSTNELYNTICKMISSEYGTLTFSQAAKALHFSEPYFSKVFHSIFGMTFTHYLSIVRITAAIEKLKKGNMNITDISADCGFNTIRNFNRVFKKFTGYTPSSLPSGYVFLYSLRDGYGLDPTLNCSEILE